MPPFSLRLDIKTETRLRRLMATTGRSRSEIVREAISQYGVQEQDDRGSAFERLRPFIGIVASGSKRRGTSVRSKTSNDTHARYRRLLEHKHGGARTR